jgi:hypothetical protein
MKYFPSDEGTIWSNKVNFVDDNNVLVGYDFYGSCCENFGWYISDKPTTDLRDCLFNDKTCEEAINESLKDWTFDASFFQKLNTNIDDHYEYDERAVFRLVNEDNQLFLHLYNIHNGYYGHGFDFAKDGEIINTGVL